MQETLWRAVRSAALLVVGTAGLGYGSMWCAGGATAATESWLVPPAPKPPVAASETGRGRRLNALKGNKLVRGIASWYGAVWDGRTTASGEIFRQSALTACHASLPFGTLVRVINLRNHRSVVVRINDRGLQGTGRVIDLSTAAAERLGMLRAGLAPVRLEILRGAAG